MGAYIYIYIHATPSGIVHISKRNQTAAPTSVVTTCANPTRMEDIWTLILLYQKDCEPIVFIYIPTHEWFNNVC